MNTEELLCVIKESLCLSFVAKNVYSADTLPATLATFPSAFICNTDPSHLPGKHWIVFWFQDPFHSECFDSLGYLPQYYSANFEAFLRRHTSLCVYNNVPIQSKNTDICGYYVIYYLLMKCSNMNLHDIVDRLKRCSFPDQYVVEYVSQAFDCI